MFFAHMLFKRKNVYIHASTHPFAKMFQVAITSQPVFHTATMVATGKR